MKISQKLHRRRQLKLQAPLNCTSSRKASYESVCELSNVINEKRGMERNLITTQQLSAIHHEKGIWLTPSNQFYLALVARISFVPPVKTHSQERRRGIPSAVVVLFISRHIRDAQDLMNELNGFLTQLKWIRVIWKGFWILTMLRREGGGRGVANLKILITSFALNKGILRNFVLWVEGVKIATKLHT